MKVLGDQDQSLRNGRVLVGCYIAAQRGTVRLYVTGIVNSICVVYWACTFMIAIQGTAYSNQCLEFHSAHGHQKLNCMDKHSRPLVQGGSMLKVASPNSTAQNNSLYAVLAEKRRDAQRRGISDEEWFLGLLTDPTLGAVIAYHRLSGCTKCKLYGILAFETGEMYFFGKDGVRTKGNAASSWDGIDIKRVGDKRTDDIKRIFGNLRILKRDELQQYRDASHGQSLRDQTGKIIYKPRHSAEALAITDALTSGGISRATVIDALHAATDMHKEFSVPFLSDPDALVQVSVEQRCFGHCPVFEAVINQDGRVEFLGIENTRVTGLKKERISPNRLDEIRRRLDRFDVVGYKDQYGSSGRDSGLYMISIRQKGKTKRITFSPMDEPAELKEFYAFVVNILREKQLY